MAFASGLLPASARGGSLALVNRFVNYITSILRFGGYISCHKKVGRCSDPNEELVVFGQRGQMIQVNYRRLLVVMDKSSVRAFFLLDHNVLNQAAGSDQTTLQHA